ncbi:MAG: hypothetical protein GC156_03630 [Actinomycetales bacterium]|nr:hypothetical protein [Actinomycetales bacterium]
MAEGAEALAGRGLEPHWVAPHARIPRRPVTAGVAAVMLIAVVLGLTPVVALLLCGLGLLAVAPQPAGHRGGFTDALAWLPSSLVATLLAGIIVVVPASALGLRPFDGLWALVAVAVILGSVAWRRGGEVATWSRLSLLAWAPALVLAAGQVFRFAHPMAYWSRPTWRLTDPLNHAAMVVDALRAGRLSYDPASVSAPDQLTIYPRGPHALLATILGTVGPVSDPADAWVPAITAVMVALAVSAVASVAAVSLLATRYAVRGGASGSAAAVAALVAGAFLLTDQGLYNLPSSGFLTTSAACTTMAVLLLVGDAASGPAADLRRLLAGIAAVLVLFYLWQPLALAAAAVTAFWMVRWLRSGHRHPWPVVATVVAAMILVAPLAATTFGEEGRAQAGAAAVVPAASMAWVVALIAVALIGLWVTRMRTSALACSTTVLIGALVAVAGALIVLGGGSLTTLPYYASKTLWHLEVVALPAAAAATVIAVRAWWTSQARAAIASSPVRLAAGILPVAVVAAVMLGVLSDSLWQNIRGAFDPGGPTPQVPLAVLDVADVRANPDVPTIPYLINPQGWQLWLRYDDAHAAQLLRARGTPVPGAQILLGRNADAACDWLRAHPDAIRITGPRRGDAELVERGCPPDVVQPQRWEVVITPPEWWVDTAWEATGGAPDPSLPDIAEFLPR